MLGYITLLYSLPDFSASIGLSTSQAAAISAYLNLGTALGRPMAGFVSDKLGRIEVAGGVGGVLWGAVFCDLDPCEELWGCNLVCHS
jgi:MFS family permease